MIKPRVGDVWEMKIAPSDTSESTIAVVIRRRIWVTLRRDGLKDHREPAWEVTPKDPTIPWGKCHYGLAWFASCTKRAPKRKKLSPAATELLQNLVKRGDLNFHLEHQVARMLVRMGLAKWVTTTESDFASLHATIDGYRAVEGGVDE